MEIIILSEKVEKGEEVEEDEVVEEGNIDFIILKIF